MYLGFRHVCGPSGYLDAIVACWSVPSDVYVTVPPNNKTNSNLYCYFFTLLCRLTLFAIFISFSVATGRAFPSCI